MELDVRSVHFRPNPFCSYILMFHLNYFLLLHPKLIITEATTEKDEVIKNNLGGTSRYMNKKGWVDPQGRKGKGFGVYRFANKYGSNVDGYSPIYSPGEWSESGGEFTLGTKGLLAWAALVVVLLGVGINAVIATSSL